MDRQNLCGSRGDIDTGVNLGAGLRALLYAGSGVRVSRDRGAEERDFDSGSSADVDLPGHHVDGV